MGALIGRNDLRVVLDGPGGSSRLNGLYVTAGRQHLDNYINIDHAKPHCTSRLYYKGILDGESRAVFGGTVLVRPGAVQDGRVPGGQEPPPLGEGGGGQQAQPGDLRRRREVRPRRDRRNGDRGRHLLHAQPRPGPGEGQRPPDTGLRQRDHGQRAGRAAARLPGEADAGGAARVQARVATEARQAAAAWTSPASGRTSRSSRGRSTASRWSTSTTRRRRRSRAR